MSIPIIGPVIDGVRGAAGSIGSGVTGIGRSIVDPFAEWWGEYKWWVIGGVAVVGGLWLLRALRPPVVLVREDGGRQ